MPSAAGTKGGIFDDELKKKVKKLKKKKEKRKKKKKRKKPTKLSSPQTV